MTPLFQTGNAVRVRKGSPPGHIRTPFYVRGCKGVIERVAGEYRNPEELAFGRFDTPSCTPLSGTFPTTGSMAGLPG